MRRKEKTSIARGLFLLSYISTTEWRLDSLKHKHAFIVVSWTNSSVNFSFLYHIGSFETVFIFISFY